MLLMTRPEKQAVKDMAFLKEHGVQCMLAPMLKIEKLDFVLPEPKSFNSFIMTSANAADILKLALPEKHKLFKCPVIAIGNQTSEAAEKAGFKRVINASGTALDIIDLIRSKKKDAQKRYIYLRGEDISVDIEEDLQSRNVQCSSIIIYKSILAKDLPVTVVNALKNHDVSQVAFLSSRTAMNFVNLVRLNGLDDTLKHTKALCISNSVLECVRVLNWESTHVSERPDGVAFKDLILNMYAIREAS